MLKDVAAGKRFGGGAKSSVLFSLVVPKGPRIKVTLWISHLRVAVFSLRLQVSAEYGKNKVKMAAVKM